MTSFAPVELMDAGRKQLGGSLGGSLSVTSSGSASFSFFDAEFERNTCGREAERIRSGTDAKCFSDKLCLFVALCSLIFELSFIVSFLSSHSSVNCKRNKHNEAHSSLLEVEQVIWGQAERTVQLYYEEPLQGDLTRLKVFFLGGGGGQNSRLLTREYEDQISQVL